jgi:hypothetical protein
LSGIEPLVGACSADAVEHALELLVGDLNPAPAALEQQQTSTLSTRMSGVWRNRLLQLVVRHLRALAGEATGGSRICLADDLAVYLPRIAR